MAAAKGLLTPSVEGGVSYVNSLFVAGTTSTWVLRYDRDKYGVTIGFSSGSVTVAPAIPFPFPSTTRPRIDVHTSVMWDHVLRSLGIEPSTLVATRGVH